MNRILVIDADPAILELLRDVLEPEGYQVTTTQSLDETEVLLSHHQFDVLLVDYWALVRWPRLACRRSWLNQIAARTPAVCLSTCYPATPLPLPAMRRVLSKPFELAELLAVLREAQAPSAVA